MSGWPRCPPVMQLNELRASCPELRRAPASFERVVVGQFLQVEVELLDAALPITQERLRIGGVEERQDGVGRDDAAVDRPLDARAAEWIMGGERVTDRK